MKQLYLFIGIVILTSCGNNKQAEALEVIDKDTVVQTQVVDTDLAGLYQVVLPCTDCKGRLHTLLLFSNGSFKLEETLIGKDLAPTITHGQWWRNENELQLLDGTIVLYTYELQNDTLFLESQLADAQDYTSFKLQKLKDIETVESSSK